MNIKNTQNGQEPNHQKTTVKFVTINSDEAGQRVDNFLITKLKNIPKSMIYRIIRKGEVRVNKGRVKAEYKLKADDIIRIPPVTIEVKKKPKISNNLSQIARLESLIIFEDSHLLVLNKPSGMAVHGGSGLNFGVIEALRSLRPDAHYLELVHRLDRDTSGVLLIAKKRSALRNLHQQLRDKAIRKEYLALVRGSWQSRCKSITVPLKKNEVASGERIVRVNEDGKASETRFKIEERYEHATLICAMPITGRTHQIRVHTLHAGHPIALDGKYGDKGFDEYTRQLGLKRLFLHAHAIHFIHPKTDEKLFLKASLDDDLREVLARLRTNNLDVNS